MTPRRRLRWIGATLAASAALAVVAGVGGQASNVLDLSFSAFTAGGGESHGGSYQVLGAMGQAQTGTASGGQYSVSSGFLAGGSVKFRAFAPFISSDR